MGFFSKLFNKQQEPPAGFLQGDIFYTRVNGQFHIYKVLKVDDEHQTYHLLVYQPVDKLPKTEDIKDMKVSVYHVPIDKSGFEGETVLLTNVEILHTDLVGYYEYLRQTGNNNELAKIANGHYKGAMRLTDLGQRKEAIEEYSRAIEIIPSFFEAIDNRAFCKMDLALYNDAIDDFNLSLKVNPNSYLAVFSIGECMLRLKEFDKAKEQFEKAIAINPQQQIGRDFLQKAIEHKLP